MTPVAAMAVVHGWEATADGGRRGVIVLPPSEVLKLRRVFPHGVSVVGVGQLPGRFPYRDEAKELVESGFWYTEPVLKACGADRAYIEFCRGFVCAHCHKAEKDWYSGEERSQAAHVRRVATGSGTGFKGPYCTVPLHPECHRRQHQKGESAVKGVSWFDRQVMLYRYRWVLSVMKREIGFDLLEQVPPEVVRAWAEGKGKNGGIGRFLPPFDGLRGRGK